MGWIKNGKKKAFTLVELLVSVGIIAGLLTLLVPSLYRAKVIARRTACATNLSLISKGVGQYGAEQRERLPVTNDNSTNILWDGGGKRKLDYGLLCPTESDNSSGYGVTPEAFYCLDARGKFTVSDPTYGAQNFGKEGVNCYGSYWQRGKNQTKDDSGNFIPMFQTNLANKIIISEAQTRYAKEGDITWNLGDAASNYERTGKWTASNHKNFMNCLYAGGEVIGKDASEYNPAVDCKHADKYGGDVDSGGNKVTGHFPLLEALSNN